ncbi:MAG: hypothetical protein AAF501_21025, partial [Pseudomonadota bacterium]
IAKGAGQRLRHNPLHVVVIEGIAHRYGVSRPGCRVQSPRPSACPSALQFATPPRRAAAGPALRQMRRFARPRWAGRWIRPQSAPRV